MQRLHPKQLAVLRDKPKGPWLVPDANQLEGEWLRDLYSQT